EYRASWSTAGFGRRAADPPRDDRCASTARGALVAPDSCRHLTDAGSLDRARHRQGAELPAASLSHRRRRSARYAAPDRDGRRKRRHSCRGGDRHASARPPDV
ncbi:MAG: hypothetical protein AVDCRST_MAG67-1234, partial [uncultured Solirubrobacteraceae bacterium]